MAGWTERAHQVFSGSLLAFVVMAAAAAQSGLPPDSSVSGTRRVVVLEDADFFAQPSSDGDIVKRMPGGTVVEYVGETTDDFGREWFTVRDADHLRRRTDTYLAPFGRREFAEYGYRAALLADRRASVPLGNRALAVAEAVPWWTPVAELFLGGSVTFDTVVAVSARAVEEGNARQAISMLGGMSALAAWPEDAVAGQLYVPEVLPLLFQFDGSEWGLRSPIRLMGHTLSVLGNPLLAPDPTAPPLAGGPALHCWDLVGALDERGASAGTVQVAPPVVVVAGTPPPIGTLDMTATPLSVRAWLPPAPLTAIVPPRVDPQALPTGVILSDTDGRQAVYLTQRLGVELTRRLRGRELVLDVVARTAPRAIAAATFGLNVTISFADERADINESDSYTTTATANRFSLTMAVPEEADSIVIRLLPLDVSLAVEQRGSVVFERVALRLGDWPAESPPGAVLLNRITASTFEGVELHTRAPVAVTTRTAAEVALIWPAVAASGWGDEDKQLIVSGQIRHGMNAEHVLLSWGEPADRAAMGTGGDEQWDYDDERYAMFSGGKVISYRPAIVRPASASFNICPGTVDGGRGR